MDRPSLSVSFRSGQLGKIIDNYNIITYGKKQRPVCVFTGLLSVSCSVLGLICTLRNQSLSVTVGLSRQQFYII